MKTVHPQFSLKPLAVWMTAALASTCLLVTPVFAQQQNPAPAPAGNDQKITMAFDNADVKDVIRWAADLTNKNIIIHPGVQGKKITVVAGEPMSKAEAWQVLLSALQVNGLAVMESSDTVKVLPEVEAKIEKIPLGDEKKDVGREDIVVRIIKVKNLAATQLINLLKPLTPATSHFAAYPETNTLILADRAGNIAQIVDIINRIDQAGTIDIEVTKLEFASAKEVAKILTDLVAKSAAGKEGGAASPQGLNITADERSNSILMTGDPVMRMQLHKLIKRLDQPLSGDGNTQVVYLNYINAKDVVPILEGVGGKKGGGGKEAQGAPEVEVNIQALEGNNAVVITAPPAMLNTMKGVIARLDVRRRQVLVEAVIVEVSENASRDLGVFWAPGDNSQNGANIIGSFSSKNAILPSFAQAEKFNSSGISLGYFRNGDLRTVIRTLEGNDQANVLSTPTVIALDNEEAKILVGESVPFRTGVQNRNTTTVVTGGSTNGTNSNTLNPYYGGNDFVQIERQDIGVTLKVKPRINQDDVLTMEIEQKVESISDTSLVKEGSAADLITNKREITTKALVRDDETLVLGGLMRDEVQAVDNGVPYLSKIPLFGRLFKGSSKSVVKKNLMVFIHPRILHDDAEVAEDTAVPYLNLREKQQQFNSKEAQDELHIDKPMPLMDDWPHKTGARKHQSPVVKAAEPPATVKTKE